MSNHQIKYNEALVERPPLKHGKVGTDHMEHTLQSSNQKKTTPNSGMHSKTTTKQHEAERVEQAKATAIAGNRPNDFGDHAKKIKVNLMGDAPGLESVGSSSKNILQQLAAGLKTVQSKQLAHAAEKAQSNFDNSVQGKIIHGLDNPEPLAESVGKFVRAMTPQGIANSAIGAVTGYDYMEGTKTNRFLAGVETALPFSGKFFAAGMGVLGRSGNHTLRTFKPGEAAVHFEKHADQFHKVFGFKGYSIEQYELDANLVIKNGVFSKELNAYVSIAGGKGGAKGLVAGLDRETGHITTLHLKDINFLERKAPSLGWTPQAKLERTDLVGSNREFGYKSPYGAP